MRRNLLAKVVIVAIIYGTAINSGYGVIIAMLVTAAVFFSFAILKGIFNFIGNFFSLFRRRRA